MFELNAAIKGWQKELLAKRSLSDEDMVELTSHLEDAVDELRTQNLSDEEIFWIAKHRLGDPLAITNEFSKVNQTIVWRWRLLWLLLGYFLFTSIHSFIELLTLPVHLLDIEWLFVESRLFGPEYPVPLPLFLMILLVTGFILVLLTTEKGQPFKAIITRQKLFPAIGLRYLPAVLICYLVLSLGNFMTTVFIARGFGPSFMGTVATSNAMFSLLWYAFLFSALALLSIAALKREKPEQGSHAAAASQPH